MTLVEKLRTLVGAGEAEYTIDNTDYWTDAQLQEMLQAQRQVWHRIPVTLLPTREPGGAVRYLRGVVSSIGRFEAGDDQGEIVRVDGTVVAGYTLSEDGVIDFQQDVGPGHLTLTADTYDLYAAAADVIEAWASAVKLGYDITTDGQSMSRSQRHSQLLEQAGKYRAKALPGTVEMVRTDQRPTVRRGGCPE